MVTDETTASITKAIIAMTQIIGLDAIAEGIETPDQLELLCSLGCDKAQGFLFSRALPPAEFSELLGRRAVLIPLADRAALVRGKR